MSDSLTRRRFLQDALFTGGALLAAALLTAGVEGRPAATPTPTSTPRRHDLPGKVAAPHPSPTPAPTPDPPPPGAVCAPPSKNGK